MNICNQLGCKGLEKTRKRPWSLSDLARKAAENGDLAGNSPYFRQLCAHSFLKSVKFPSQTAFSSLMRTKSYRLLEVFLGFFQTLSLQCLAYLLCIYLTDSGSICECLNNSTIQTMHQKIFRIGCGAYFGVRKHDSALDGKA